MKINLKQEQNCLLQQHTPNVEEAELCLPRLLALQEDMGLLMQQSHGCCSQGSYTK